MKILKLLSVLWLALVITSCSDDGADGLSTLINLTDEPAGSNCIAGGIKIETGTDLNGNGTLDADEVEAIKYLCESESNGSEIRLAFDAPVNIADNTEVGETLHTSLININFDNFSEIDSAAWLIDSLSVDGTVTFDLYDLTNNAVIAGTTITASDVTNERVFSSINFKSNLPSGTIDLGLKYTYDGTNTSVYSGVSASNYILILYQ